MAARSIRRTTSMMSPTAWETAFENSLLLAILDAVRRETNPRTYLAFELVGLEGLSGGEAARLTGLSRNAVYKAHKRVLERLVELARRIARKAGSCGRSRKRLNSARPRRATFADCADPETMRSR